MYKLDRGSILEPRYLTRLLNRPYEVRTYGEGSFFSDDFHTRCEIMIDYDQPFIDFDITYLTPYDKDELIRVLMNMRCDDIYEIAKVAHGDDKHFIDMILLRTPIKQNTKRYTIDKGALTALLEGE